MLDRHGFKKTESINNEWNYVKGWTDDWVYSLRAESGDLNLKSATLIAATMTVCQSEPLDMLMFYDARSSSAMNSLFDPAISPCFPLGSEAGGHVERQMGNAVFLHHVFRVEDERLSEAVAELRPELVER